LFTSFFAKSSQEKIAYSNSGMEKLASSVGGEVEHSPHHLRVKGSCPAVAGTREKCSKRFLEVNVGATSFSQRAVLSTT